MFMKRVSICLAIVGALISWSCAVTDVDRTADLTHYKTFGWGKSRLDVKNPAYKGDLIEASIKTSVKQEFARKGITYSARKPDLLVSYEGFTEAKEDRYQSGGYYYNYYPYYYPFYGYASYGPRFYYGGYWGGPMFWSAPPTFSYSTTEGTLILDLRDRKTGKLVWRGMVQGDVDNVKSLKKNIAKGVKAILKKYPAVPPPVMPIPKGRVV